MGQHRLLVRAYRARKVRHEHCLYQFWANVDIVGDHREDILVQMRDGSIRAYVNTDTPPARRPCKWQNRAYQMLQAPGDYRYFIAAIP